MPQIFQSMLMGQWVSRNGDKKLGNMGIAKLDQDDLVTLAELLEAGKIVPVIDASYPLSRAAEAFRYVEDEHAQGKVIITVNGEEKI
jgi:NADPH:quinone reductase-like Zn-dependent oxidoreductase